MKKQLPLLSFFCLQSAASMLIALTVADWNTITKNGIAVRLSVAGILLVIDLLIWMRYHPVPESGTRFYKKHPALASLLSSVASIVVTTGLIVAMRQF